MTLSRGSRWFLVSLVVMVALGWGAFRWVDANIFGDVSVEPGLPVTYVVQEGQTVRSVGDDLVELGVVANSVRFRLAAEEINLASRMLPGSYDLLTGMTNEEVFEILLEGPPPAPTVWFTVQEGLTIELTLARLAAQFPAWSEDDFREVLDARRDAGENADGLLRLPAWLLEPGDMDADFEAFEGVLFPETYEVLEDASPSDILQRMVNQLDRTIESIPGVLMERMEEQGLTRYDMMVIASLIERETRVDAERPIVAGVINNRLEEGMRLQIDATVLYARGEHTDRVLFEDTEIDSPYNTYRIDGLPPTPISGFGAASLRSAFDPADVTFRYYVLDPACDGSHLFADTLDQHNANVAAFRDAGGCR
ncbi:MAG: endolytic transglycosylase MltG [Nitriliruptoraceae bacterium]